MHSLLQAAAGRAAGNAAYQLECRRSRRGRLCLVVASVVAGALYPLATSWACDDLGIRLPDGTEPLQVWGPYLVCGMLAALLAATVVAGRKADGLWDDLVLARIAPGEILAAHLAYPLRAGLAGVFGVAAGLAFVFLNDALSWDMPRGWLVQWVAALAAAAVAGALGTVSAGLLGAGLGLSTAGRFRVAAVAATAALALQAAFVLLGFGVLAVFGVAGAELRYFEPDWSWSLGWAACALLHLVFIKVFWRRLRLGVPRPVV